MALRACIKCAAVQQYITKYRLLKE